MIRDEAQAAIGVKVAHPRFKKLDSLREAMIFMALRGQSKVFEAFYSDKLSVSITAQGTPKQAERKGLTLIYSLVFVSKLTVVSSIQKGSSEHELYQGRITSQKPKHQYLSLLLNCNS